MKTLSIFDMSPFLHAGHINKRSYLERLEQQGATWVSLRTPTGGTSLLFNKLYELVGVSDIVMVCDRKPTIKTDMDSAYKATREHKPEITIERGAAEYILQQCNVSVVARAGYEADDLAYTYVKLLHDKYDKINIYTCDSDYYFMVDDVVSILPSSSKAKTVTMDNYHDVTGYSYNLMTISKILSGDTSDNIPALPKFIQQEVMNKLYTEKIAPQLGSYEVVKYMFDTFWPQYAYQVDLVFPLTVPDLPQTFLVPDKKMICNFGNAIRNSNFIGRQSPDFDIEPHIDALHKDGIYLEVSND